MHNNINKNVFTFKNGRFCNQLYYLLQAYKFNGKYQLQKTNRFYDSLLMQINTMQLDCMLDFSSCDVKKINSYCQEIGKDFTIQELENFIKNIILKSKYFNDKLNKFGLNDKDLCLYIRNTDYITLKTPNCFNRIDYFEKIFQKIQNKNIKLIVQSDDIEYCKQNYQYLISKYFTDIEWYIPGSVIDDFIHLCSFKNKIIINSTFSIWSAFISNVLFKDSYQNIICPNVFMHTDNYNGLSLRYDKRWNIVNVIKK